jgi:hypothetical protein
MLKSIATKLLSTGVYGCDILEAGYNLRAGVDLAHHVALWDVMSRNGVSAGRRPRPPGGLSRSVQG